MNERIKELAEQAMSVTFNKFSGVEWSAEEWRNFYDTKFAELIVKECAQVCLAQRDPANLNYKPSVKFAEAVKQHFGVEE